MPFGTFEFLRMPFGLKNAGQTFQRMMDEILSDLDYLFVYMDDVLVASRSMEEHIEHFRELFRQLAAHDLVVSPGKCQFDKTQIEFLGHTVTKEGVLPLPSKVAAVTKYPAPSTQDELRRFLGMINFYNIFVPNATKIMKPLYEATAAKQKKHLEWNDDMNRAFNEAKTNLARATILRHPRPGAEIAMSADASGEAVGAVLQQRSKRRWRVAAIGLLQQEVAPAGSEVQRIRPRVTSCLSWHPTFPPLSGGTRFSDIYRSSTTHVCDGQEFRTLVPQTGQAS